MTKLTAEYLKERAEKLKANGYPVSKWIVFARLMLKLGLEVDLYEAQRTVSKYLTVQKPGYRGFKVRFSNHKPIPAREANGDCDFFVGRTNQTVTNTKMAIDATLEHFDMVEPSFEPDDNLEGAPVGMDGWGEFGQK